jgi:antitoxin (DNA-binding transcriptional repressor) of toxin-antitoxin stability system
MKKLTIREIRQSLSHLDELLAVEEEVMITRRGDPIAKVVQVGRKRPIPSHRDLRDGMPQMRKGSETVLRKDRDEK